MVLEKSWSFWEDMSGEESEKEREREGKKENVRMTQIVLENK